MSHASCIVVAAPEQIEEHGGIEEAVAWNMSPFDENGEWFREASRWDWWQIGGRYTGKFAPEGYDPKTDPANIERCNLCNGTGDRPDLDPPEWKQRCNGCNGCHGKGTRPKWPTEWADVGNVARRDEIDHLENKLRAYSALRNRVWYEQRRLGWFGGEAATECELAAAEQGKEHEGRCIHTCEKKGAKIVSFGEGDRDDDRWDQLFWPRFIRSLPPDTTLVCVDYHV